MRFQGILAGLSVVFLTLTTGSAAQAQQSLPEFRFIATRDVDFYGADREAMFDTDLTACVRACSADTQCAAFTFNTRSNACFTKSEVKDQTPYEGAVSAIRVPMGAALHQQAKARLADLDFLGDQDLARAADLGRDLGLRHQAGGYELDAVLDAATLRRTQGDTYRAMIWTGMGVVLSDRADLWSEYARLLLNVDTDSNRERRRLQQRATGAAINGYLRSDTAPARASALLVLAEVLEASGRGRNTIPVLRLAADIQSRPDVVTALDKAIGKYGFRITDSQVESDSAAPRICAEFSSDLAKTGVDYAPFVLLPDTPHSVQAEGRLLCVDGLEHGMRYRITFREGLPAADGETMARDTELTLYVRDRSPMVRFPGRSYVLPKSADAALPVQTVNLTTLDLQLRRVSDRNLLRAVQDGYFGRPLSYWEDEEFAKTIAQEIWSGTAETGNKLNAEMLTRLPMGEAIADQPPGIYALSARIPGADPWDDPGATQWFVLSDMGLSTMSGTDGLHVTVRGLADAQPKGGVELTLISRANAVLGRLTTDDEGYARFASGLTRGRGGAAPALVLAEHDSGDVGFLSLTDPAFDLSDRGVEGRAPAGPIDLFLATDRGAYRAGETIHATALTRDGEAQAIEGLPLIAVLRRPDGVEYSRHISDGGQKGGHVFALPVDVAAPRGTWRLDMHADADAPALASQTVLVEDFLPERIDFDIIPPEGSWNPGDMPWLTISALYLFGAPGADLTIDGQVALRAVDQVEGWPGFRFGRYDSPGSTHRSYFGGERTDAAGMAELQVELPSASVNDRPLTATITASLADGSARPVERQITMAVNPQGSVIGIRPLFEDGVVAEGTEAGFELIALDPDLQATPMPVRWTLNRVETRYQWYQLYGNWNWEPTTRRTRIATGEATLGGDPVAVAHPVEWGEYELVVERIGGEYVSAARDFYAGWYQSADAAATPDRLDVSLDKPAYAPGDTAMLRIVPRMAGTALITVMSNRVIERHAVEVEAGDTVIPLQVIKDWGTGAYVTATVIRPMNVSSGQNPARALGLAHATVEPVGKTLAVTIDAPELAEPRRTQPVRLAVAGAAPGDQVWVTLAAVDLGILNLTAFDTPNPEAHYFGQRRLGMELRDVYGRLIDGMNGAMGQVRSGGDQQSGMRMQSPPPTQDLMAVFSGPVQVGADGTVDIGVPLIAFNGTVRLMALAWSGAAVGHAEFDMTVRDPVVLTASVPRFLAPGDQSRIRLEAVHAGGPSGVMELAIAAGDGLRLGQVPSRFQLDEGGKTVFAVPVTALADGDPRLTLTLTTPDGRDLVQKLTLPVRSNDPLVALTRRFDLAAGGEFTFSNDVFAEMRPGTGRAILSAGPLARFDAPGLLERLDRYPYGCTEQVTSAAMPLLYLSSVAEATGLGSAPDIRDRIDTAINRVLTRQAANGAFGLWRAVSGDFWLDAYVTDFLSRARGEGHAVPDQAFAMATDNLRNHINYAPDFDSGGGDIAYALMVLAREGAASMGDLRYYADVKAEAFDTPIAAAQLGAAMAYYGDQARADAMFARAAGLIRTGRSNVPYWRADYGTYLRDSAAVLALATEAGSNAVDTQALATRVSAAGGHLSTQEASWSLLAAHELIDNPEASGLLVDGAPVRGPFVQVREDATPDAGTVITSAGDRDTFITLTTLGVPSVAPPEGGTGYAIKRRHFTMEGKPLEIDTLQVGDRFVTVLQITAFEGGGARLMIDDPLPAGVEIDNPSLLREGDVRALEWLQLSEAAHSEFRSDRFLSAVDLRKGRLVSLAYIARAVTPGEYHHPAASVEDMYRPRYRARTGTGRITVTE